MRKVFLVLIAIGFAFWGCKKNNDDDLTSKEKQVIISSYNTIDALVNDCYNQEEISDEYFNQFLKNIQAQPMVEEAYFEDFTLVTKFEKGGYVFWDWATFEEEEDPEQGQGQDFSNVTEIMQKSTTEEDTPTKPIKVCIINSHYYEPKLQSVRAIVSSLEKEFKNCGFNDIEVKNGQDASVDFFLNDLNKYGVIIFFGHGYYKETRKHTWFQTGVRTNFEDIINKYFKEWKNNQLTLLLNGIDTTGNVDNSKDKYILLSNIALEKFYKNKTFPNSLIYLSVCEALKNSKSLAQVFTHRGAGVVMGWDDLNSIGRKTSKSLFLHLLNGKTVKESLDALKNNEKFEEVKIKDKTTGNLVVLTAALTFYPNTDKARNMRLIEPEENVFVLGNWNLYIQDDGEIEHHGSILIKEKGIARWTAGDIDDPDIDITGTWSSNGNLINMKFVSEGNYLFNGTINNAQTQITGECTLWKPSIPFFMNKMK